MICSKIHVELNFDSEDRIYSVRLTVSFSLLKPSGYEFPMRYYLPTPPLGQDMTQGQFLSGV